MQDNPLIQIYVNRIKNRIAYKIKTGYKLELLSPETMKLLRNAKQEVDKHKMENMYQNYNQLKLF